MINYIISQIFVIISYSLLGLTYLLKNRKIILVLSMFSIIANGAAFGFLSAWAGLAVTAFALLRNLIFLIQNKKGKSEELKAIDWAILSFLIILSVIIAIFTYDTFWSLFSIFGSLLYTIAIWQKNVKVYKILGLFSELTFVVYGVFIRSVLTVVLELLIAAIDIVVLVKDYKNKNLKVEN